MEPETINEANEQETMGAEGGDSGATAPVEFAEMVGSFSGAEEAEEDIIETEEQEPVDDDTEDAILKALLESDTEPETAPAAEPVASEDKPATNPNAEAAKYFAADDAPVELTQEEHDQLLIDPTAMSKKLSEVKAQGKLEIMHALPQIMYPMVMPLLDAAIEAALFTRVEHPEYSGKRYKALEAAVPVVKAKNPTATMREILSKAHEMIEASLANVRAAKSEAKRAPVRMPQSSARAGRAIAPGFGGDDDDSNEFDELTAHYKRRRI